MRFCFMLVITGVIQLQLSLQDPRGTPPAMPGNSSLQDETNAGDDIEPTVDPRQRGRGRAGPGTGSSADWSFCSNSAPCDVAQGDCDSDSHCKGSLTCGKDNCRDFYPGAHKQADCCVEQRGIGGSKDWSYCTKDNVCGQGEGDCDNDSECSGTLVCGTNNCKDLHPSAQSAADCCIEGKPATGFLGWSYCKQSKPCELGQGDCDNDSECGKDLKCGENNCQDFDPKAPRSADCCIKNEGCKCGITRKTRIVGGQATEVNEYPWIALLRIVMNGKSYRCSGSLVASQWIVTAAHCVFHENQVTLASKSMITVILGEHDTSTSFESKIPRKELKVEKIISHDVVLDLKNDIALLKLSEKVDLNTYTPVCVPSTGKDFTGKRAWTYGWGRLSTNGPTPSKLQEIAVKIVSDRTCQAAFDAYDPRRWTITSNMVCAGGVGGEDSCQGDSGGPLSLPDNNQHVLAGIVSWGHPDGCALANMYGVYAETAKFKTWLDNNMAANGGMTKCIA